MKVKLRQVAKKIFLKMSLVGSLFLASCSQKSGAELSGSAQQSTGEASLGFSEITDETEISCWDVENVKFSDYWHVSYYLKGSVKDGLKVEVKGRENGVDRGDDWGEHNVVHLQDSEGSEKYKFASFKNSPDGKSRTLLHRPDARDPNKPIRSELRCILALRSEGSSSPVQADPQAPPSTSVLTSTPEVSSQTVCTHEAPARLPSLWEWATDYVVTGSLEAGYKVQVFGIKKGDSREQGVSWGEYPVTGLDNKTTTTHKFSTYTYGNKRFFEHRPDLSKPHQVILVELECRVGG